MGFLGIPGTTLCLDVLKTHVLSTGLGPLANTKGEGNGTPTPVLLPGKSHGQRSLVGCSPRGR